MCNTTYDAVTMFRDEMYIFKSRVSNHYLYLPTIFFCLFILSMQSISLNVQFSIYGESVEEAYIQIHRMKLLMYGIYRMI